MLSMASIHKKSIEERQRLDKREDDIRMEAVRKKFKVDGDMHYSKGFEFPVRDKAALTTVLNSKYLRSAFTSKVDLRGMDPKKGSDTLAEALVGYKTPLSSTHYFHG